MSCVALNDTVDISGVTGWATQLAWYGQYPWRYAENYSPSYTISLPSVRQQGKFYIDPEIFGTRLGMWYQYADQLGGIVEGNANLRAFDVEKTCIVHNVSIVKTPERPNETQEVQEPVLPVKKIEQDILLANDNNLALSVTDDTQMWAFGYGPGLNHIYGYGVNATQLNKTTMVMYESDLQNWQPGTYKLMMIHPDVLGKYEVGYDASTDQIMPAWRNIDPINITLMQPMDVMNALSHLINTSTGNPYEVLTMSLQEPDVTINQVQYVNPNNLSYIAVRGYTNELPGTTITLQVDADNQLGISTLFPPVTVTAGNESINTMRTYNGTIRVNLNKTYPGPHTITATLPNGKQTVVTFYNHQMPKDMYVPPAYVEYIGNWSTVQSVPIIITKYVYVNQTVYVNATPTENRAYYAQPVDASTGLAVGTPYPIPAQPTTNVSVVGTVVTEPGTTASAEPVASGTITVGLPAWIALTGLFGGLFAWKRRH